MGCELWQAREYTLACCCWTEGSICCRDNVISAESADSAFELVMTVRAVHQVVVGSSRLGGAGGRQKRGAVSSSGVPIGEEKEDPAVGNGKGGPDSRCRHEGKVSSTPCIACKVQYSLMMQRGWAMTLECAETGY